MPFDLRSAGESDAAIIARMHTASWRYAYRGMLPDSYLDGALAGEHAEHWREVFAKPRDDAVILVAERDAEPLGFVAAFCEDADSAFIENLHVMPEQHGKGLGQQLMAAAATQLRQRGCGSAYLWVIARNEPAIRFYRRLGGRAVAQEVESVYGNELEAIRFVWDDLSILAGH